MTGPIRASLRALIAAALGLAAAPATAGCTWEWLCNGEGVCKHMPVCDSVHEVPPPAPADAQPPSMPPLAMRPHRAAAPLGALTCEHIMRKGQAGRWYWSEACFCADPSKARDPSAPFANIVRCEAR